MSEYIITKNLPDEFKSSLPSIEEIEAERSGVEGTTNNEEGRIDTCNNNENYGRWAFVEFTEMFEIEAKCNALLERTDYEN